MFVVLAALLIAASLGLVRQVSRRELPASLPRVRSQGKRVSLRARWAYLTDCRQLFLDAYRSVGRMFSPEAWNVYHGIWRLTLGIVFEGWQDMHFAIYGLPG